MMRISLLLAAATMALGISNAAQADLASDIRLLQTQTTLAAKAGLNWRVGDKASYKLDIGGFIKGKSDNSVTQDTGTHFWMVQDMDLSIQKQKIEAMINKSNGQIDKLLVNGQEQSVPKSDQEILEMKESSIDVMGRNIQCIYAKIKDKANGNITEAWINPQEIPMSGMLKAIADSQFGKVVQEVTSGSFAN